MSESLTDNGSPLLQDVIIRGVFYYLDLWNLKVCRQVCTKWRCLSHPFLQQHRFCFKFIAATEEEMHVDEKESKEINLFLRNFENVPPVKFVFEVSILNDHVNLLTNILDRKKNNLKFVAIDAMEACKVSNLFELYDISEAVLAGDLTSLTITGRNISISMSSMCSISVIDLEDCKIPLPNERIAFAVRNLKLSSVNFLKGETLVEEIVLDDFFNFQNLKYLDIMPGRILIGTSLIKLHMKSRFSLDTLQLYFRSSDTDWPFLNLTIKKLKLKLANVSPSTIPNSVQLQELELLYSSGNININFIPQTLKRLTLWVETGMNWQRDANYQQRILPNLNYLKITNFCEDEAFSFLEHFGDAIPNLRQLYVENRGVLTVKLNAGLIPPIVKQIKLDGNVQFCGDNRMIYLNSIIIENYQLKYIDDLFKYCEPKLLIIASVRFDVNYYLDDFNKLLQENKCEQIAIGKFVSRKSDTANTRDTEKSSKYYILEKRKTCVINLEDFRQLLTF